MTAFRFDPIDVEQIRLLSRLPPGRRIQVMLDARELADELAYCRWLSEVTDYHCHLPSATERAKAAAGRARQYPWGTPSTRHAATRTTTARCG